MACQPKQFFTFMPKALSHISSQIEVYVFWFSYKVDKTIGSFICLSSWNIKVIKKPHLDQVPWKAP